MSYQASTMPNNMRLAYRADGTPMYTSMGPPTSSPSPTYRNPNGAGVGGGDAGEPNSIAAVTAGINAGGGEVVKRKRGRPRKRPQDDSMPSPATLKSTTPADQTATYGSGISSPALSSGKKPRGRPRGSVNKQQPAASGSPGAGFMPHVLDVKAGEDVLAKLMWFSQNSPRTLCVLSANGSVSNVTLQQSAISGGTVTYEGRFEILSLSGSFMVSKKSGQPSRTGGLSVALSGPDGRVLGGHVAGLLTAASPVQVVIGSFILANDKERKPETESPSECSGGGLGSPLDHTNNPQPQGMANINIPWR